MKRIFLLSDTHGYVDDAICRYAAQADEVWHAGDIGSENVLESLSQSSITLRAVFGNIDDTSLRKKWPEDAVFEIEGLKVWITHIGGYPGKYVRRVQQKWNSIKPGLFICGHSHILKVMYDSKNACLHMNPGAAGIHGFHQVRTALRFQVRAGKVENLEVIEFGKRAQPL
ncbi:MAG: metallophosphatase family protein [Thermaurantimonas aggregans]|nr:metallophosphoesterase family protein [Thermaurantimonas aggregans]MCX8149438.1 metallophosphatase family protein [Thermaurantimonas aggregans]